MCEYTDKILQIDIALMTLRCFSLIANRGTNKQQHIHSKSRPHSSREKCDENFNLRGHGMTESQRMKQIQCRPHFFKAGL